MPLAIRVKRTARLQQPESGRRRGFPLQTKKGLLSLAVTVGTVAALALSQSYALNETHLDKSKLPDGCSSCHKGHGTRGTVMLQKPKDEVCFICHGPAKRGTRGEARTDIHSVTLKRSNHPVTRTSRYHVTGENLPERSASVPRHVSCYDCHNVHLMASAPDGRFRGLQGYSGRGAAAKEVRREHVICYRCHSDSVNLPQNASNIARKFDPGNASYHPVEATGRNRSMPSLKKGMSSMSLIDCSNCHGNDDAAGPKGPHGSVYEGMLRFNYTRDAGAESPRSYALCYECHNRNSILNDESFRAHKRHVVFGSVPCFACHDAHGSTVYENLIRFDRKAVFPNSIGQLTFTKAAPGRPRCFLSCHTGPARFDHKIVAGRYCINTNCPQGW